MERISKTGKVRIPKIKRQTLRPEPMRPFQPVLGAKKIGGPGEAPAWIITPTTSRSEWFIWWALMQILGPPGESSWGYQISSNNSATIIDFVVWDRQPRIAIRVQSERYHISTLQSKHTYDRQQREMLERSGYVVIDVYEEHFLKDKSGFAAIMVTKDALKHIERPSPIRYKTGMAKPV